MTLFERVFGGNDYNYDRTVAAIDSAIAQYGESEAVSFPDTAYSLPCYYAVTGVKITNLGEMKAAMATINSYLGLLCHYDTYRIRRNAMMRAEMYRYFDFTPRFTKAIMKKEPADYETLKKIDYKSLCH